MFDFELSDCTLASDICALETVVIEVRLSNSIFKQAYLNLLKRKHVMYGNIDQQFEGASITRFRNIHYLKCTALHFNAKGNIRSSLCPLYLFLLWFVYNAIVYILIAADILNL